jgi:hypothetical protein
MASDVNGEASPVCAACGQERPANGKEDMLTYEVGNGQAVWHWRLCGKPSCLAIAAANTHMALTVALQGSGTMAPRISH